LSWPCYRAITQTEPASATPTGLTESGSLKLVPVPQPSELAIPVLFSVAAGLAVFLFVRYGIGPGLGWYRRQLERYEHVLRQQLLLDVPPQGAFVLAMGVVGLMFVFGWLVVGTVTWGLACAAVAFFLPYALMKHLEQKRRLRLERQLVGGLTSIASGVRAGLNLVQAIQLVADNHTGPIAQEFGQIMREYHMGRDLHDAMRSAANRIGSPLYRLTFTAIEMHRLRGGDTGESMDRISESIREIERLEGKLDALTSQGRTQAWMMAVMPVVFLGIFWVIDPEGVSMLFTERFGQLMLIGVAILIVLAFFWIRKIMAVDI
jgi:tight adherence protein B